MIINWTTPKHRNILTSSYGAIQVYQGKVPDVTLEDLLECCQTNYAVLLQILRALRKRGFRKERISREDLQKQNNQLMVEIRNIKRALRAGNTGGL
jgi:hypothetical protein